MIKQARLLKHVFDHFIAKERFPGFLLPSKSIKTLREPSEFYDFLLERIAKSKTRIVLSSLYIGTDPLSKKLLDALITASDKNPKLKIKLVIDKYRGQRPDKTKQSSYTLLQSALNSAKHPDNILFRFIKHNEVTNKLDFLNRLPLNEFAGIFHSKIAIFDDSVLMTGANLSLDYYTNRKDRYVLLENSSELTNYLERFYNIFVDIGDYIVKDQKTLQIRSKTVSHLKKRLQHRFSLFRYNTQIDDERLSQLQKYVTEFYKKKTDIDLLTESDKPMKKKTVEEEVGLDESLIVPAFQSRLFSHYEDEKLMKSIWKLLSNCKDNKSANLTFASGYFNPVESTRDAFSLFPRNLQVQIITCHPTTNSFFNAGRIKGRTPAVYRITLLDWVRRYGNKENFEFYEYLKKGSTYHVKGIWFWQYGEEFSEYMTIFGSSNFAMRSYKKDLEAQFYFFSNSPAVVREMEEERKTLFEHKVPVTEEMIMNSKDAPVTNCNRLLRSCFKDFG